MPSKVSADTLLRQWELLKIITHRPPGDTVAEIYQKIYDRGFRVTRRTIERDLAALSGPFPIMDDDEIWPTRWRWRDGSHFDLPGMELPDAVSLTIIKEVLEPLLPTSMMKYMEPRFEDAAAKIQALSESNTGASWVDKVRYVQPTQPLIKPAMIDYVLEVVQEALMEDRQLMVEYVRSAGEDRKEIRLHPLGLFQRGQITYLVAMAFEYKDVRRYVLHRMAHAEVLDEKVERPDSFNLVEWINEGGAHFGEGKEIRLKIRVSRLLAEVLDETPLSQDMKIREFEDDGWAQVTATVTDTEQLYWWIQNWCTHVVVIGPKKLRQRLVEEAELLSKVYLDA